MDVNHWLIYMNNFARFVVKRVTMRIVNCRPGDRMVDIHSEEGSSEFISECDDSKCRAKIKLSKCKGEMDWLVRYEASNWVNYIHIPSCAT